MAALEKENRELGERSAAVGLEASEKGREVAELDAKLAAASKAAEKLRQALKKLERERDARPLPEALVWRPSLCLFTCCRICALSSPRRVALRTYDQ